MKAGAIKENIVELDVGEILRDLLADIQEQTVSEFPKKRPLVAMQICTFYVSKEALLSLPTSMATCQPSISDSHLHNVGLVDGSNTVTANLLRISESITSNTLRSLLGDQLDRLNNTIDNLMMKC